MARLLRPGGSRAGSCPTRPGGENLRSEGLALPLCSYRRRPARAFLAIVRVEATGRPQSEVTAVSHFPGASSITPTREGDRSTLRSITPTRAAALALARTIALFAPMRVAH